MINRPFTAQNRNVFNEATFTSAPATIGTNNVIVSQALNRSIFDQNSTCISNNPQPNIPCCAPKCAVPQTPAWQACKECIPGGISFTFNPLAQNYALQGFSATGPCCTPQPVYPNNQCNPCCPIPCQQVCEQSLTLEQQIALKQLEREGLELLLLQKNMRQNPYKIRFHYDGQTSTTDLCRAQQATPYGMTNFVNTNGATVDLRNEIENLNRMVQLPPDSSPTTLYSPVSKAKRLILTKSPDIQKPPECEQPCECPQQSQDSQEAAAQETDLPPSEQLQQTTTSTDEAVQTKVTVNKKKPCKCCSCKKSKGKKSRKKSPEESSSSSSCSESDA